MWINEPKFALTNGVPGFTSQALEHLDSGATGFDIKQFTNTSITLSTHFQYAAIKTTWHQMQKWPMRSYFTVTYLLMSSKRHLPGRKANEHHSTGSQISPKYYKIISA